MAIGTPGHAASFDVVVIGGGLAGLRAALEASLGGSVAVVSKVHPLRSHSVSAQGGINAALGHADPSDSWQEHVRDTIEGSDDLADPEAVEVMCRAGPEAVRELEHMGAVFSRTPDGRIAQRPFGGAGSPRTCYSSDRTGHDLLHTLYEQAMGRPIEFCDECFVTSLVHHRGRCVGCFAWDVAEGGMFALSARSTVLACGGHGQIYQHTTNSYNCTGDGAALALNAGAAVEDMEFVQFHPTALAGTDILVSEASRGEGGKLINGEGERFMRRYAPEEVDLAPRDVVARGIQTEIDQGRGVDGHVLLDITGLGERLIEERLPGTRRISVDFASVDPVKEPMPVHPAQHYSMGGVAVDVEGRTSLPGLLAAGECACVSVHGANRLGGNSLLEAVAFGRIAGRTALRVGGPDDPDLVASRLPAEAERLEALFRPGGPGDVPALREELQRTMSERFGIFRSGEDMLGGLERIRSIARKASRSTVRDGVRTYRQDLISLLELRNMALVAEAVALASLWREESRGSHCRTDRPERDDGRFRRHSLIRLDGGKCALASVPVGASGIRAVKGRMA